MSNGDLTTLSARNGDALLHAPTDAALEALAQRYGRAQNLSIRLLTGLGNGAEGLFASLPPAGRAALEGATQRALMVGLKLAAHSRGGRGRDVPARTNTLAASLLGAFGGIGGLPTAMVELPMTLTLTLRAIIGIAAEYGFDPDDDQTRLECLMLLGTAGPLAGDDSADLGLFAARMALTGTTLNAAVTRLAPKIAAKMSPRLASRAVPLLGAAAGAAINASFTRYYQEMAHVHFGLRRLAEDSATPLPDLTARLKRRITSENAAREPA